MTDVSYDAWLRYIFDREASEEGEAWYWGDLEHLELSPSRAALYTSRLFSESTEALCGFSDAQVALGIEYMVNPGVSDHGHFLQDGTVPQTSRIDAIAAMAILFRDVFAERCRAVLSHLDEPGANLLNGVCYMWWDVIPLHAAARGHRPNPIEEACLAVMRDTLRLPNPACQESALHGLGLGRTPIRSLRQRRSMLISPPIRRCGRRSCAMRRPAFRLRSIGESKR